MNDNDSDDKNEPALPQEWTSERVNPPDFPFVGVNSAEKCRAMTAEQLFGLFFTDYLLRLIVGEMNRYSGKCMAKPPKHDGAGNMSGKIRGCATRFQEVSSGAPYFHCASHSLNLALLTCQLHN